MNFASPAELIRQAREKVAKNQQEFGNMLGKDQSLVSRYERGLASPPSEVVMHCLHILNAEPSKKAEVSLDELVQAINQHLATPAQAKARALLFDLLNELTAPRNA